jgi:hypothetical protein
LDRVRVSKAVVALVDVDIIVVEILAVEVIMLLVLHKSKSL